MSGQLFLRLSVLALCVAFSACKAAPAVARAGGPTQVASAQGSARAAPPPPGAPRLALGAPLSPSAELSLADMLKTPKDYRDRTVTVEGRVKSACTRRGCWMQISSDSDPSAASCRVTFKDYAFFVPTDSAGSRAKVQGSLTVDSVPPERVAHLESEGAKFADKNSDGSANELRLVATGVELWR